MVVVSVHCRQRVIEVWAHMRIAHGHTVDRQVKWYLGKHRVDPRSIPYSSSRPESRSRRHHFRKVDLLASTHRDCAHHSERNVDDVIDSIVAFTDRLCDRDVSRLPAVADVQQPTDSIDEVLALILDLLEMSPSRVAVGPCVGPAHVHKESLSITHASNHTLYEAVVRPATGSTKCNR